MKPILPSSKTCDAGFSILESLIMVVVVALAATASASLLAGALQGLQNTREGNLVQDAIENNKVQIDDLAKSFTCCSGTCTTTPPTTFGANQPCATNNPNDDRHYFPQLDLTTTTTNFPNTTTPSEPIAVDQLCATSNNTNFMTPLKTAIDGLAQPSPATRAAAVVMSNKMLRVEFTAPGTGTSVRTIYVKPRMANFCS